MNSPADSPSDEAAVLQSRVARLEVLYDELARGVGDARAEIRTLRTAVREDMRDLPDTLKYKRQHDTYKSLAKALMVVGAGTFLAIVSGLI
ncbi:MAG TPA: hypothetical protein VFT37_13900 [Telluria sp.]|nr:hypothetical protein [Telluria sp.]